MEFQNDFIQLKKILKDNGDIIVTKADKGNTTVMLNKNDCVSKVGVLLKDESTYLILDKDHTITVQNKNDSLIEELVNQKVINCSATQQKAPLFLRIG